MSILIGADIVPTKVNMVLFETGAAVDLIGAELEAELRRADYRIFNLEVPLYDEYEPIDKIGGALLASSASVNGLKALGADLFTLANNHIMDQGAAGLDLTIKLLNKAGINYVGAGDTLEQAAKPFIFEHKGRKVGVYACAEHEFSIASDNKPGANPVDLLESPDHIEELKKHCDYLIVLYHGGKEFYRYPSPQLQKVCRKFVEKGANLVVCQHSHCIGAYEWYNNSCIVYGQGNFIFDDCDESEYVQTSVLVKVDDNYKVSFIPFEKNNGGVKLAEGESAHSILSNFEERSEQIKDPLFVPAEYERFAQRFCNYYLRAISGKKVKRFWFRALDKLSGRRFGKWYFKREYGKQEKLLLQNYIECEAHRELLLSGIKLS